MNDPPDLMVMGGYAHLTPLAKQAEAMQPGAGAMVQELLGCAWGRKVWTMEDQWPCAEQAKHIVVVHNPNEPDEVLDMKLCDKHNEIVLVSTTPHGDEYRPFKAGETYASGETVVLPPSEIVITEGLDGPVCPHCGSGDMDRGATGLDLCRACGGLSRDGKVLPGRGTGPDPVNPEGRERG